MESNRFEYKPQKETVLIRAAIDELRISQKEIAVAINKSRSTVCEALRETKRANPTLIEIKSFLAVEILKRKRKTCNR